MEMKPISVKLTEVEINQLNMLAAQANMSRSDYIRKNLFNESVHVVDRSKQFYQSLISINEAIGKAERCYTKVNFDEIRKQVMEACLILNL